MTVGLICLGCPKNLVDAELMLGTLEQHGYRVTNEAAEAEMLIVNTCSFIEAAREEAIATILEAAQLKEKGRCRYLVVTGCLVQMHGEELRRELPEVDAFVGVSEFPRLPEILAQLEHSPVPPLAVNQPEMAYPEHLPRRRATPPWTAYLKIAEGCDGACTFCTIPALRGKYRSRPPEAIIAEAERLAKAGVKELILVAEDTTYYGIDLAGRRLLPDLLRQLGQISGLEWIRLLYGYPTRVDEALMEVMATEPKICAYLDLPLQHADDGILRAMGRAGHRDGYLRLVRRLREYLPEIALRSTFIVGFPGEGPREFAILREFLREARLDRVGFFLFSPEPGTPAAEMPHQVPPTVAEQRLEELVAVQAEISRERNETFLGRVLPVLIEGIVTENPGNAEVSSWKLEVGGRKCKSALRDGDVNSYAVYYGRSYRDAPEIDGLVFVAGEGLTPGDLVPVRITAAEEHDLHGCLGGHLAPFSGIQR